MRRITRFTSTQVQILTPEARRCRSKRALRPACQQRHRSRRKRRLQKSAFQSSCALLTRSVGWGRGSRIIWTSFALWFRFRFRILRRCSCVFVCVFVSVFKCITYIKRTLRRCWWRSRCAGGRRWSMRSCATCMATALLSATWRTSVKLLSVPNLLLMY
jgi:hypothetical protein